LKNSFTENILRAQAEGATPEDIHRMLREARPKRAMLEGDVDNGQVQAGQGVGLINDIVPAAEVIRRIVTQYGEIVKRFP
jgi:enoyl-[acyl-carrier protein] reductase II